MLSRWIFPQFRVTVIVVRVVTDANEFLITIHAGEKDDSAAEDVIDWDSGRIWGIRLEDKHVPALSNGSHVDCV